MSLTLRAVKGSQLTQAEMDANMKEIGFVSSTVASAATTDLNTATGNYVPISGTTNISSFGSAAPTGTMRILKFAGALTLTYGASAIVLPGAVNFVTRANDILVFVHEGSGLWRLIDLLRADGSTLLGLLQFTAQFDNGSTPGATPTIDPTKGARQKITLNVNVTTFTITAPPNSLPMNLHIDIFQDATGTRTWPAGGPVGSKWKSGADKVLSTPASSRDRLVADYDGANWICDLMKGIA